MRLQGGWARSANDGSIPRACASGWISTSNTAANLHTGSPSISSSTSRNLIFADGVTMQRVFDAVVDRTRSRLDVPKIRTIFGTAQRPRRTRKRSSVIEAAIETPTFDLTVFKLHFGRLTGKAYTKGERVLRFEAIAHNSAELRCGRMIEKFPEIVTRLAGVVERFATALD
jgi:hypothetical protein